ncbi:hypothetical protein [Maridesulfovibrio sp.]|uniref:hypothetical protein n=1 Tax=Maridesulfovibrio sp. TaxID=2795000 RepID=UPI0029C9C9E3|nr:hypothetical protein [Maridesulfovibrio sp.]
MSFKQHFCMQLLILFVIGSHPVFAHRVSLFAYVEGDTVFTESYFSKKRKVHQGKLEIFSTGSNKLLLTGITDDNGDFNFPIPETTKAEKSGLLIKLHASEGHQAVWTLTPDEIFPDSSTAQPAAEDSPSPSQAPQVKQSATIVPGSELAELSSQVKTLSNKVETLKRLIISQQEKGPGVNEIFSGIGYILGLFGIAAFFLARKK